MQKFCQGCEHSRWRTYHGSHLVEDVNCVKEHNDMGFAGHYMDTASYLGDEEIAFRKTLCRDYEAPEYF